MTGRDPGHAGGAQTYVPPAPACTCGHAQAVHDLGRRGGVRVRTACSTSWCRCRLYRPATCDPDLGGVRLANARHAPAVHDGPPPPAPGPEVVAELRAARLAAGLRQRELDVLLGRTAGWVSHVETGRIRATREICRAWLDACEAGGGGG